MLQRLTHSNAAGLNLPRRLKYVAILVLLYLSLGGFFFAPKAQAQAFPTYALALIVIFSLPRLIVRRSITVTEILMLLLLAMAAISLCWSMHVTSHDVGSTLANVVLVLCFVYALVWCAEVNPESLVWLLMFVVFTAALAAIVSIVLYYRLYGFDQWWRRLVSWNSGRLGNAAEAAMIYGQATIIAFSLASMVTRRLARFMLSASSLVLLAFTVLTLTRSALLAIFVGTLALTLTIRGKNLVWLIPALLVAYALISATLAALAHPDTIEYLENHAKRVHFIGSSENDTNKISLFRPGYGSRSLKSMHQLPDGGVELYDKNDDTIGLISPAFRVEPDKRYRIYLRMRSVSPTKIGAYVRIEELDSKKLTGARISVYARYSLPGTVEADRQVNLGFGDMPLSAQWKDVVLAYKPTPLAHWASLAILNWKSHHARVQISKVEIFAAKEGPIVRFTDSLNSGKIQGLIKRGLSSRDIIWRQTIDQVTQHNHWVGFGMSTTFKKFKITNFINAKHAHSIYYSTFYYLGLIGLILLVSLIVAANNLITHICDTRYRVLAASMLTYGIVTLMLDGNRIVSKIDVAWFLIWLPIGLAIAWAT